MSTQGCRQWCGWLLAGKALPADGDFALDCLLVEVLGDRGLAGTMLPLEAALTLYGLIMASHFLLALNAGELGHAQVCCYPKLVDYNSLIKCFLCKI